MLASYAPGPWDRVCTGNSDSSEEEAGEGRWLLPTHTLLKGFYEQEGVTVWPRAGAGDGEWT